MNDRESGDKDELEQTLSLSLTLAAAAAAKPDLPSLLAGGDACVCGVGVGVAEGHLYGPL